MIRIARIFPAIMVAVICCAFARGEAVYDVLERAWSPHLSKDDPAAFAMKIRAVSVSPRSYWGGAKDLFFVWAKRECADWLASGQHEVICHADVHAGNIGSYPSEFGKLAIGLIDFDDAAKLPAEIDLLQACISLRLAAMQNKIELSDADAARLCRTVFDSYNAAAKSSKSATELPTDESSVQKLLKTKSTYDDLLSTYTSAGEFRRAIVNKKHEVKEILTPAMGRADELAAALADAARRSPRFSAQLRATNQAGIRRSINAIATRTRLGSAGSQGLDKIFIWMDRPLRDVDHDVILYLKQEVPSAAERTGAAPLDPRTPGERVSAAVAANCDPEPIINVSCEAGGRSYLLTLFEPWSAELEDVPLESPDDLSRRAHIMGIVLGAAHRLELANRDIEPKLAARSADYLEQLLREWESLRADPRAKQRIADADAFIESAGKMR